MVCCRSWVFERTTRLAPQPQSYRMEAPDWKKVRDLLRNAVLHDWGPDGSRVWWQDVKGNGITDTVLKGVLKAIAEFGHRAFPSEETIGKSAGVRKRTVQRAIRVLQAKDLLKVDQERGPRGNKRNYYTILPAKLEWLARDENMPIMRQARPAAAATLPADDEPRAWEPDPSALGTEPSAYGDNPRALGDVATRLGVQTQAPTATNPRAYRGALTSVESSSEEVNEAPTTSDVDGARWFDLEERAEIARLANQLGRWLTSPDLADRELVLKVATLQHDGRLSENAVGQLLESFEVKASEIGNRYKWLWQVLRNQCSQAGGKSFDSLLKTTDFPRQLLTRREVASTERQ